MWFFTADEHYGHANIIKYCKRPFKTVDEMTGELVARHNQMVGKEDTTVHAGDFCWRCSEEKGILAQLNGDHILLEGSHDGTRARRQIWQKHMKLDRSGLVVVCHYAMRTWASSHYNSWQLHGHSHGRLPPIGKQLDVGVDDHNFYPWSWPEIVKVMATRADNPGYTALQERSK